jgi:hypothetical protein
MATRKATKTTITMTERAKLAARTKAVGATKSEFRKGWEACDDDVLESVRESDARDIESYKEQLLNGVL